MKWLTALSIPKLLHLVQENSNPLAAGRGKILSYDNPLTKAAAAASAGEVVKLLTELRNNLVKHNSDVSRILVNGLPDKSAELKPLFLEHNAKYRETRDLINALISHVESADLHKGSEDGFAILSESHNNHLFGSLLNLRISISYLEETWAKMAKFEDELFGSTV